MTKSLQWTDGQRKRDQNSFLENSCERSFGGDPFVVARIEYSYVGLDDSITITEYAVEKFGDCIYRDPNRDPLEGHAELRVTLRCTTEK
jgi:hypothetical protein